MFFGAVAIAQVPIADDASATRVSVTGVVGTAAVGSVAVTTGQSLAVTGVQATATHGVVTGGSLVVAASFPTVMSLGTVIQRTTANIAVTSPTMNGIVNGLKSVTGGAIVTLTGVQASGEVGNVILWGNIAPSVNQIWTPIAA